MGFYTAIDEQTIQPGQSVIFTLTQIRDNTGNVKHNDGTGSFVLSGGPNKRRTCCPCCDAPCKQYPVNFGANIAIPTGGTVAPITVAFSVGGSTVPASAMEVTPAAVEQYFNISREMPVAIFCGCCQTVTVTNTSDQAILMKNATIEI